MKNSSDTIGNRIRYVPVCSKSFSVLLFNGLKVFDSNFFLNLLQITLVSFSCSKVPERIWDQPASYSVYTERCFVIKWPELESGHLLSYSAEVKNAWSYASTLLLRFITRCLSTGPTLPLLLTMSMTYSKNKYQDQ
jgi:hypothetical protein